MSDWIRVNKANPCPICGKDSWCTFNDEVVICMRDSTGGKEKQFRDGSVGFVHTRSGGTKSTSVYVSHREKKPEVTINAKKLMDDFHKETLSIAIEVLARNLGVMPRSLIELGCAFSNQHRAYAFPMSNGYGDVLGIRLRSTDGRKWAVTGSKQGIFLPPPHGARRGYVCEGPTDTAAALSLGLFAMGRPHCAGGIEDVKVAFRRYQIKEAVIVSDNDEPGRRGAAMMMNQLMIPSVLLILPCKDMREFLNKGGTATDINSIVDSLVWHQPISAR